MKRFLRYAMERDKKLRAVYLREGAITQKTVSVVDWNEETVTLRTGSRGKSFTIPMADLLSCDYARGDHGEDE